MKKQLVISIIFLFLGVVTLLSIFSRADDERYTNPNMPEWHRVIISDYPLVIGMTDDVKRKEGVCYFIHKGHGYFTMHFRDKNGKFSEDLTFPEFEGACNLSLETNPINYPAWK